MAAKFSMVNGGGLFGAEDHLKASDKMSDAMQELKVKNEQKQLQKEQNEQESQKQQLRLQQQMYEQQTKQAKKQHHNLYTPQIDGELHKEQVDKEDEEEDEDDEILLESDPELERLRAMRLAQLKKMHEETQKNLAKGHGQYREISQDEFLSEVTSSKYVVIHFYHRDFERCKILDKHMEILAKRHVECKFLKLNAEKAPFFVEKLKVRIIPTLVCFDNGVALMQRQLGFEGLVQSDDPNDQDSFETVELAHKLVEIGVINWEDEKHHRSNEQGEKRHASCIKESIYSKSGDCDE